MALIEVKDLSKHYYTYRRGSGRRDTKKSCLKQDKDRIFAVNNLSFSIYKGEICGILGLNGAGKSTTLKMLCGGLYPTTGMIRAMGYFPANDRPRYVRRIGTVFGQKSQLLLDKPPVDSFTVNKAIYDIPDATYTARLNEMAAFLSVEEVIHKPTQALSLGERMKCEFIMAMLHAPEVVFLDEPLVGLDPVEKAKIQDFIREMNRRGTTFILASQDLDVIDLIAQHIIILHDGKKVFDSNLAALRSTLGEKKWVGFTLDAPYHGGLIPHAKILEQDDPRYLLLEVDTTDISIPDFLSQLKGLSFTDLSVRDLSMEQVITSICIHSEQPELS